MELELQKFPIDWSKKKSKIFILSRVMVEILKNFYSEQYLVDNGILERLDGAVASRAGTDELFGTLESDAILEAPPHGCKDLVYWLWVMEVSPRASITEKN